ncbi:redox-regulated ATPase YchF [Candidatus Beckwithbacteria bacterium]|nr:redox-regulated ATPase YchF [Candidatus Beckwithbacteria bacterium]
MSLSVGIVGLPNVGKSTLFNALLKKQQALAANYPFATIEPNVGIVEVKDERVDSLAQTVETQLKLTPNSVPRRYATIEFVDIAGLVAGASQGEGLGNKFLANIREADLICHVLRAFTDSDVVITGKLDPIEDLQTVRTELILKDMETVKRAQESKSRSQEEKKQKEQVLKKVEEILNKGEMLNTTSFNDEEIELIKPLCLLTIKPEIFAINLAEADLKKPEKKDPTKYGLPADRTVFISAKLEAELAQLSETEQKEYLAELSLEQSGIEQMARLSYRVLDLISFLTAGEIEARAWTITKGTSAVGASAVIHTDFAKKFIKAHVVPWQNFVELGGWKTCREQGKVRQEGRDYIVVDGDVIEFAIGK